MSMSLPIGEAVIVAGIYHGVVRNFDDKQQKILVKFDGWPESSASWYPPDKVLSLQHSGRNARRGSTGANKAQSLVETLPAGRNAKATKHEHDSDEDTKHAPPAATVGSKRPRARASREPAPSARSATRPAETQAESSDEEIPAAQPVRKPPTRQAPDDRLEIESQEMAQHPDGPLQHATLVAAPVIDGPIRDDTVVPRTMPQMNDANEHSRSISATSVAAGLRLPALAEALSAQPGGMLRLKVIEMLPMNPSFSDTDVSVLVSTSWAVPDADTKERLLEVLFSSPHPLHALEASSTPAAPFAFQDLPGFRKLEAGSSTEAVAYIVGRVAALSGASLPGRSGQVPSFPSTLPFRKFPQPLLSLLCEASVHALIEKKRVAVFGSLCQLLLAFSCRVFPFESGCGYPDDLNPDDSSEFGPLSKNYISTTLKFISSLITTHAWNVINRPDITSADAKADVKEVFAELLRFWDEIVVRSGGAGPATSPDDASALIHASKIVDRAKSEVHARVLASIGPHVDALQSNIRNWTMRHNENPDPTLVLRLQPDSRDVNAIVVLSRHLGRVDLGEQTTILHPFVCNLFDDSKVRMLEKVAQVFGGATPRAAIAEQVEQNVDRCAALAHEWDVLYKRVVAKVVGNGAAFLTPNVAKVLQRFVAANM